MGILSGVQSIVIKIANKLGLTLSRKDNLIDDYDDVYDISLTATIAQRVSTLTLMDTTVNIKGSSDRALYLNKLYKSVIVDKLDTACEVALGTGDVLIKPYTDGERIGIDIIKNSDFYISESIGDFIKSCIIRCESINKNNGFIYERYEAQRLSEYTDENGVKTPVLIINTYAFKNGIEVPLTDVPEWKNIEPEIVITGVNKMLFGRIKCPTTNRMDVNGVNGVPITYGLGKVLKNSINAYDAFNDEFYRKEAFIFADKTLFKKDKETGKSVVPRGKERLFMTVPAMYNDSNGPSSLITEYSPEIRDESFENYIEQNFKMLEMLSGLSSGILTKPITNYATATEIKTNLNMSFAYFTRFRRSIEKGLNDLIDAINTIMEVNGYEPYQDYQVSVDWSSAYLEDMTEQFTRLIQAEAIGCVSKAEVRAWLLDEDVETAENAVRDIESSKNSNTI